MPRYIDRAPALTDAERAELIDPIRTADPETFADQTAPGPGRFEGESDRELAHALECYADGGNADEYGDGTARVGRCLHITDGNGFQTVAVYPSDETASAAMVDSESADD